MEVCMEVLSLYIDIRLTLYFIKCAVFANINKSSFMKR